MHYPGVDELFRKSRYPFEGSEHCVGMGFVVVKGTGNVSAVDINVFVFDGNGVFPEIKFFRSEPCFFQGFGVAHKDSGSFAVESGFFDDLQPGSGGLFDGMLNELTAKLDVLVNVLVTGTVRDDDGISTFGSVGNGDVCRGE